jgi:hypothetical protein
MQGVIDIAGGALLFRAGSQTNNAALRTLITRGHNSGAWNGTNASGAINSSLAAGSSLSDGVGYGLGSEIAVNNIGGFAVNPNDTLLRYTLDGDADLNQTVNFNDLLRITQNYNATTGGTWTKGDFTFDNAINFADLLPATQNYNQSAAARVAQRAPSGLLFADRPIGRMIDEIE